MCCYTNLHRIDLSGCSGLGPKVGEGLAVIPRLPSLRVARCTEINDKQISRISDISQLTDLDIADCFKVTDSGVKSIAKLSALQSINLTRSSALQSTIRTVLDAARNLRSVTLAGTSCTDATAENLAQLEYLNKLDISNTAIGDTGITKVPIEVWANLEELSLTATQITDSGLSLVGSSGAQLRTLALGETSVTVSVLAAA